jgi:RNA polymerase sigma-70 factor, ECF subfamily
LSRPRRHRSAEASILEIEEVARKNGYIGQGQSKYDAHGTKDESLVWRVTQKDEEALSVLYDRYGGLIYAMGKGWLGDSSLAEDLVQDVFISVWRNARSFDPSRASFATWIHRIARNRATDLDRKRRARPRVVAGNEALTQIATDDSTRNTADDLDVAEALFRLSPELREVLILAYCRGLTQREIAQATDTPLGTTKKRITTALKTMRSIMLSTPESSDV